MDRRTKIIGVVLAGLLALFTLWRGGDPEVGPSDKPAGASGLSVIAEADLPSAARETLALIDRGGPFPYDRDGVTFENRERLLPDQARGYYNEYTVPTPGSADRGSQRIVVGDGGDSYYTSDHYRSFAEIDRD